MSELKNQLAVFHDPFAGTTKQPKIPDGKVSESLGYSTQAVTEIRNAQGEDVMHLLMFPGQNGGVVVENADFNSTLGRGYLIPGFVRSGGANWSQANYAADPPGFPVIQEEGYAQWRVVSQGMQLKLLNSVEEDDGWWEAVRVNESLNAEEFLLTTTDDSNSNGTEGIVAPVIANARLIDRNLVNENSYTTGLLRDLHNIQFRLNGKLDHHDFTQCKDRYFLQPEGVGNRSSVGREINLISGYDDNHELINAFIDPGYDYVYVRLHCRTNNGAESLGSRFHLNIVANQEVCFERGRRESRYETANTNIGANAATLHAQVRNAHSKAAHSHVIGSYQT